MIRTFGFLCILIFLAAQDGNAVMYPSVETTWSRMMKSQVQNEMLRGYTKLKNGEFDDAAVIFASIIKQFPDNPDAHTGYGSALYWLGNLNAAFKEFDKAISLDENHAEAHILRGIAYSIRGKYNSAEEDFLYAVKISPWRGDIYMNLGSLYAVMGDMQKSLSYYRRSVQIDRQSPLFRFQLAKVLVALGRDDDAENELRRAIFIHPAYEDAVFELARLHDRNDRPNDATSLYRRAIKLKPGDSVARFFLSNILYREGRKKEFKKAISPAFQIAPPNDKGGMSMGLSYSRKKPSDNKKQEEEKSEKKGQGGSNTEESSYPKIEELLDRIPSDHDVKLRFEMIETPRPKLEIVALSERKPQAKMASAMKKTDLKYTKREFVLMASDINTRESEIKKIQKETEDLIRNVSKNNDLKININLDSTPSDSVSRGGRNNTANIPDSDSENTAKYIPRNVGNDMGLWIYGEGWLDDVSEMLDLMSEENENSTEFRLVRGLGYLLMGETELALRDFSGKDPIMALGRSAAYTASGEFEKAADACREALAADPDNKIAAQNLKWLTEKPEGNKNKLSGIKNAIQ